MERSRRGRLTFAAVAVAAATLLAACGDDDDSTATTAAGTAATTASTSGGSTSDTTSSSGSESTTATSGSGGGGGGGKVGSKQDYVDAAESGIRFEDEALRSCVAEALVTDDVYAAIQKAEMSVDDFKSGEKIGTLDVSESEAKSIAAGMADCGDLLPAILSGDEAQLQCARQSLSNDQVAQILSYSLFTIDLPADLKAAGDAVGKCVSGSTPSTT